MLGLLFVAAAIFFSVSAIASCLTWIKLWEEKNYDLGRVFTYLRETKSGKNLIFGPESIVKWIIILLYGATLFAGNLDSAYRYLVAFFYFALFLGCVRRIINRDIIAPSISGATVSIFILAGLVELLLFLFAPLDRFLWLLLLEKLVPILVMIFVMLVGVFFDFNTDIIINQAVGKIRKQKRLLSIAVVGSYGRGSTKEFISRVLSQKYNVLETKTSFNNALGIARTIMSDLTSKKQIFIAEMDDYKQGDIKEMCGIISPSIAVVCGINEQKMSTFGSIDSIVSSKYEAIESLSRDGIGLFNGNNEHSVALFSAAKIKKFSYLVGEGKPESDVRAVNIKESKFSLSFDVIVLGKRYKLSDIKLLGAYNIENLLPAIFIGAYMGIDFVKIRHALQAIKPLQGTMNPMITKHGVVLIDDTYNANINSVLRAAAYSNHYKGRRVLVLEPLLELGGFAIQDHYNLGLEIGRVFNMVFLTSNNYYKAISEGIAAAKKRCKVMVAPPAKIANFIKKECGRDDVVIFEGRAARVPLSSLQKESVYQP